MGIVSFIFLKIYEFNKSIVNSLSYSNLVKFKGRNRLRITKDNGSRDVSEIGNVDAIV